MAKTGKKLTKAQHAAMLHRVAELSLRRGLSQEQIAVKVHLSQSMVSRLLEEVTEYWRGRAVAEVQAFKGRQLSEIALAKTELWDTWDRSKADKEITETERGERDGKDVKRVKVRRETREGNPAILGHLLAYIKEENEIMAVYPPKRQEHTGPDGEPIQHEVSVAAVVRLPSKSNPEQWKQEAEQSKKPAK